MSTPYPRLDFAWHDDVKSAVFAKLPQLAVDQVLSRQWKVSPPWADWPSKACCAILKMHGVHPLDSLRIKMG